MHRTTGYVVGLGWAAVLVSGVFAVYYNVIVAWVLYYLGHSFTAVLPWSDCGNSWNTLNCAERGSSLRNSTIANTTKITNETTNGDEYVFGSNGILNLTGNAITTTKLRTPSEEFWQ